MTSPLSSRRRAKTPPPGETGQEALYLRSLSERQIVVTIKLRDGETVRGWIEYFDDSMLRLTREGLPNLFIYKHQIRTISEAGRKRGPRTESAASGSGLNERKMGLSDKKTDGLVADGAVSKKAVSNRAASSGAAS
jgi:host factor-I protein